MAFDVSVIIPTYNRAALLCRTLDSVLSQSYPVREVIVADDGSQDDTEAMVAAAYPAVRYLSLPNAGAVAARIAGAAHATSSWLCFLDSDDLWLPQVVERHASLLRLAPDVPYSFGNFRVVIDDVWQNRTKFDEAPDGYFDLRRRTVAPGMHVVEEPLYARLLRFQPIFPSAAFIRRDFYDRIGGWDEAVGALLSHDLEFTLRCVKEAPVGVIDEPLVGIRKHSGNRSGAFLQTVIGQIGILRFALEHHHPTAQESEVIREQIRARSADAAHFAFEERDFVLVRQLLETVPLRERSAALHVKWLLTRLRQLSFGRSE